jgi:hypothetical protein
MAPEAERCALSIAIPRIRAKVCRQVLIARRKVHGTGVRLNAQSEAVTWLRKRSPNGRVDRVQLAATSGIDRDDLLIGQICPMKHDTG